MKILTIDNLKVYKIDFHFVVSFRQKNYIKFIWSIDIQLNNLFEMFYNCSNRTCNPIAICYSNSTLFHKRLIYLNAMLNIV